jgi:Protein of unknown function (DUF3253)
LSEGEAAIRAAMLSAVAKRGVDKTICPSEIARALFATDWQAHMQNVRDVAYALQDAGELVDGRTARGAIRLRMKKT